MLVFVLLCLISSPWNDLKDSTLLRCIATRGDGDEKNFFAEIIRINRVVGVIRDNNFGGELYVRQRYTVKSYISFWNDELWCKSYLLCTGVRNWKAIELGTRDIYEIRVYEPIYEDLQVYRLKPRSSIFDADVIGWQVGVRYALRCASII